jgi:flavin reductase (DIM6/NTAB) family NADH-FMN oxidoreductase RutF
MGMWVSFSTIAESSGKAFPPPLPADRLKFRYAWPDHGIFDAPAWERTHDGNYRTRTMPESREELNRDSRWPAFFPSPICITTTTSDRGTVHVEKVVGASIVNRFPYVVALSYCREPLSSRHYVRRTFMDALEGSGRAAVQFLMPGEPLRALMSAIASVPEDRPSDRFAAAGLSAYGAIFDDAYLVYQCRLAQPGRDFSGASIYAEPWIDIGSHRVYFLEIESIALDENVASGRVPLHWRSLPVWRGAPQRHGLDPASAARREETLSRGAFVKSYQPDYVFPSTGTIAFDADEHRGGFAVKHLPPLAADQVEVDNDRARWPCFFPSSVGLITVEDGQGRVGGMACGSTTILSRYPLTVAICVSYARINERYGRRASLDLLEQTDRFGCGVPYYSANVLEAIRYLGNVSRPSDPEKVENCGLTPVRLGSCIAFAELPVHFGCRIVARQRLGTHILILGEVENVFVHRGVTPENPLEWCPWAGSISP